MSAKRSDPPPSTHDLRTDSNTLAELRDLPRWVRWRRTLPPGGSAPTRVPLGSTLQPAEWAPLKSVLSGPLNNDAGVGFVFTKGVHTARGWLIGLDLDACVHPDGSLSPWAAEVLDQFPNTFVELSPSGVGLHVLLLLPERPRQVPRIRVPADAPAGVTKRPEIQVFGCGAAGYLTITGRRTPGSTPQPALFPSLGFIEQRYAALDESTPALPTATGDVPSLDSIDRQIRASPMTSTLADGDWQSLGLASASEGWWRLSRAALRAANNDGAAAAHYLLTRTAYGRGLVESRDPSRYARPEWVRRDLARVATKTHDVTADVFGDGFDIDAWQPPRRVAAASSEPWVLHFDDFQRRRAAARFLYKNFLPARGLGQLYGDPACGKTPFAVSLAVHAAAGLPWFGYRLKRPCSVVYVIGEDETGIIDRFTAQVSATDPLLTAGQLPLYATTRPGRLMEPENRRRWVAEIRAAAAQRLGPPLGLVIVDTQNRNFGPGNENDTEDMTSFVEQLDAMSRQLDVLVLLVHHTGHAAKDRGRGSSVLFGALDVCFEIQREGMNVVALPRKAKNWAEPKPLYARLVPVVVGQDDDGEDVTAITLGSRYQPEAFTFPVDLPDPEDEGLGRLLVTLSELPNGLGSHAGISKAAALTRKGLRVLLERAVHFGLLQIIPGKFGGPRSRSQYNLTRLGRARAGLDVESTDAPPRKLQSLDGVETEP